MGVKRKQHSAQFKAQVAMAALSGDKTLGELSGQIRVFLLRQFHEQFLSAAAIKPAGLHA